MRNKEIDILKGIGIISIVIGHAFNTSHFGGIYVNEIRKFVYIYHLSIFFFCSGYLFDEKYIAMPGKFLIKKIKSLYVPFLGFGLLGCILDIFRGYTVQQLLSEAASIILLKPANSYAGAMWFVRWLLLTELLYIGGRIFVRKVGVMQKNENKVLFIGYLLCMVLGMYLAKHNFGLWNIDVSLIAAVIMFMGGMYRKYEKTISYKLKPWHSFVLAVILFLLNYITGNEIEYSQRLFWGSGWLFLPMTIGGVIFCITLAKAIEKAKIITYITEIGSRYSYWIMALHMFVFKVIDKLYFIVTGKIDYEQSMLSPYGYPQLRFIYICAGVMLPIIAGSCYRKIILKLRENIK